MASLLCRGKLVSELLCKLLVENKMSNFAGQDLLDKADNFWTGKRTHLSPGD